MSLSLLMKGCAIELYEGVKFCVYFKTICKNEQKKF